MRLIYYFPEQDDCATSRGIQSPPRLILSASTSVSFPKTQTTMSWSVLSLYSIDIILSSIDKKSLAETLLSFPNNLSMECCI